jgi:TAP-like protein
MGISGNLLDADYSELLGIPDILSEWASQCIAAYQINGTSCPFAEKSMRSSDPIADILSRINAMTSSLANQELVTGYSILDYSESLPSYLSHPSGWSSLGQLYSELELFLEGTPPPRPPEDNEGPSAPIAYNENLTLYSYQQLGSPPYSFNTDLYWAIACVDASLDKMSTEAEFVQYLAGQISQHVVLGYSNVENARCLSWPNVSSYNVENYRSAFPSSLNNKILMVVETLGTTWGDEGALSTYAYVGSQNAVCLSHDAIGNAFVNDPNNCTYDIIREFFLTGITD